MTGEPTQYPFPVAPGGMGSPDYQSFGGGGGQPIDVNSLREYLPQPTPRTNSIRNNSMQGAAIGSPGTLPTNWSWVQLAGLTQQIIGVGTQNGVDYIDIRLFGTTTNNVIILAFEAVGTSGVVAAAGQVWTESLFAAFVGGSLTNLNLFQLNMEIRQFTAGGAGNGTLDLAIPPSGFFNFLNRLSATFLTIANTAFITPTLNFSTTIGVAIDFTIRIGWPQLEQGPGATTPLRTTGAAVTRTTNGGTRQPYLGSPPAVVSIAGFGGAGAGAMILNNGSDADRSQGLVSINVGVAPGSSGTIVLNFPAGVTAGQYVVAGEWLASAALGVSGSQLTITWTANRTLNVNEDLLLAYQWAASI